MVCNLFFPTRTSEFKNLEYISVEKRIKPTKFWNIFTTKVSRNCDLVHKWFYNTNKSVQSWNWGPCGGDMMNIFFSS